MVFNPPSTSMESPMFEPLTTFDYTRLTAAQKSLMSALVPALSALNVPLHGKGWVRAMNEAMGEHGPGRHYNARTMGVMTGPVAFKALMMLLDRIGIGYPMFDTLDTTLEVCLRLDKAGASDDATELACAVINGTRIVDEERIKGMGGYKAFAALCVREGTIRACLGD